MPAPKPMKLFFIDNQGEWPVEAQLIGDLVVWPDKGKYPTFTPVAMASAADFDGRIVMMAGNRGLVMAFCPGAKDPRSVQKAMSGPNLEQYRIDLTAIVQRMLIHRHQQATETDAVDGEAAVNARENEVNPAKLLTWLARSSKEDAVILINALRAFYRHPFSGEPNDLFSVEDAARAVGKAEELLQVLEAALASGDGAKGNG